MRAPVCVPGMRKLFPLSDAKTLEGSPNVS
jgi:hypothetical protein